MPKTIHSPSNASLMIINRPSEGTAAYIRRRIGRIVTIVHGIAQRSKFGVAFLKPVRLNANSWARRTGFQKEA